MKRKVTAGGIWGLIYPVLIHYGITMVVTFAITIIFEMLYFVANPEIFESITDFTAMDGAIEEITYAILKYTMHMTFVASAVCTPLFIFFMIRDKKQDIKNGIYKEYEKVAWYKYLLILPFAFFVMYGANIFITILQNFMPDFMIASYEQMDYVMQESSFLIMFLTAGIMGPIVEELVFRGLIYKRLLRMTSEKWAAIISAIAFGAYHMNWIQAPYAFILGIAMAFLYRKFKTIWAPILFHMVANIYSVVISEIAKNLPTEEVVEIPLYQELAVYLPMLAVFGGLSVLFWIIVNKTVNAKEIKNEVIDGSDSML